MPLLLTLLLVIMIAAPAKVMAAQATVDLGLTSTFAVLAGTTITNTGATTITGSLPEGGVNVGLSPGYCLPRTGERNNDRVGCVLV